MTEKTGPDYSATLYLPQDRFPDARRPAEKRAGTARPLERDRPDRKNARGRRGQAEIRAARRPALRQWQHPYRPCAQQDPEGSRRALAAHDGQGRQLRAGLGLPRPADRMEDRGAISRQGPQQGRSAGGRVPPGMPRLRRGVAQRPARGVPASRRRRRLGRPLRHDGFPGRKHHRPRNHEIRRQWPALSRLQAGDVVGGGEDRAGRSGSGI